MAGEESPDSIELVEPAICQKGGRGPLLPLFGDAEQEWPRGVRVVLYLVGLLWCFMGVSLIADVFMTAIEKVTSKKIRRFDKARGRWYTFEVWNATVANLTLMALGSSAPEILLNVIDIFAKEFFLEGLGPGTIVGSAAFNLFVIIAVCVVSIPDGQTRMIKETTVYICTATWSIFAYLWLLVILLLITPNVVDVWEGVLTFLFFPIMTFMAWACDKGWISGGSSKDSLTAIHEDTTTEELVEVYASIRRSHGQDLTDDQVARIMAAMGTKRQSRARYRVSATRAMCGGKRVKASIAPNLGSTSTQKVFPVDVVEEPEASVVFLLPKTTFAVMESVGDVPIRIVRAGDESVPAEVYYTTVSGTATAKLDFEAIEGWLRFEAGETEKVVSVKIIDDNEFEEDEVFYFRLSEGRAEGGRSAMVSKVAEQAAITIIDDDDPGVLSFDTPEDSIIIMQQPNDFVARIVVQRKVGSCGEVRVKYYTEGDTALPGRDFESTSGELVFAERQLEAIIEVTIKDVPRYEMRDVFRIFLTEPEGGAKLDPKRDGGAERNILTAIIEASPSTKATVDRVRVQMQARWDKSKIGHANWYSQFKEALHVNGGDDEDGAPSIQDYVTHVVTVPWKLLFALVPPTDYCGGWLCFFSSLIGIAFVTMIINDMASLLGCVMCLSDEVTAITFVAMGTSVPDTFASMVAAKGEPYADSSVGNVTGSNSVNVFLGLGLPWMIAAIAWAGRGSDNLRWQMKYQFGLPELTETLGPPGQRRQAFVVLAGSLAFSVAIFTACAIVCIVILYLRRRAFGGELGGPKLAKWATFAVLVALWFLYIGLSAWRSMQDGGGCKT